MNVHPFHAGFRRCKGFTLVELLVVISVVGILMALLLPALGGAREASRRATCTSNLRQLAQAACAYHFAKRAFPPGNMRPHPPREVPTRLGKYGSSYIGVLPYLLPHLEQDNLYDQSDILCSADGSEPWWTLEKPWAASQVRVASFLCPSTDAYGNTKATFAGVNYYKDLHRGTVWNWLAPLPLPLADGGAALGRTNYLPSAGRWGTLQGDARVFRGVFAGRVPVRAEEISDGESNTILFGETTGGLTGVDDGSGGRAVSRLYSYSWMGSGGLPTEFGFRPVTPDSNKKCLCQFHSDHPGVVQFCFADGSVHALLDDTDTEVIWILSGISDRRIVSSRDYE